ncbi:MAG: hypothetical protein V3T18_06350 [Pseudomonadales bacterium]
MNQMTSDKPQDSPDALLGDLESIRTLLDEDSEGHSAAAEQPLEDSTDSRQIDDQVPLLEDVVAGAAPSAGPDSGMDDALFDALLDDNWKETAAELLDETRSAIIEHGGQWTQQATEDLDEALRVRINATLAEWLRNVVQQNLADLRAHLLQAARTELSASVKRLLNDDSENQPAWSAGKSAGSAESSAGSEDRKDG